MPPYAIFRDPQTGEEFVREMTEDEFAAYPDSAEVITSSTPKPELGPE